MSAIFYSSMKSVHLKRRLFWGTPAALLGAVLLLYESIVRIDWGFPLFLLAFCLMAIGLLPYRRLKKLDAFPSQIVITEERLIYFQQGKVRVEIPLNAIRKLKEYESYFSYGITVSTQEKKFYFPFFSARTCKELKESL